MRMVDGELVPVNLGVPFGAHARLVMLYIMTQSVKTKSREIFLGDSFSAWLRRMGIENTNSGGERASRTLVQEQVDRLMACEWTIRFDQPVKASSADLGKIGRAHVCTPVTNAHLVCRLLLEQNQLHSDAGPPTGARHQPGSHY